jgi:hypothetical protein
MKTELIILCALAAVSVGLHAQVVKCTGADGKVTYTQGSCDGKAKASALKPSSAVDVMPAYQPIKTPSSSLTELNAAIAGHLAAGNIAHARTMAVTAEQFQMVSDAEQAQIKRELDAKAARRAARPIVCTTTGHSIGGNYNGVTVCPR